MIANRIIPARAGFTAGSRHSGQDPRDHPRSRGVYDLDDLVTVEEEGSSPLARGLPVEVAVDCEVLGIIPARAGFTRQ